MASLGLVAALGSMLLVSLAASAGPSAWGKFFRDYSAARYCWRSSTPSCPCHLHTTVHSDRQGPARHGATQARPRTGRICHSRSLHGRKVAHRNLSQSRGAQFSQRCGRRADRFDVLDLLSIARKPSSSAPTKTVADERAPTAKLTEERFTKAWVRSQEEPIGR